jgi:hypothetical protein
MHPIIKKAIMADHTEFIPTFRAFIQAKHKDNCFVLSCRILGEDIGFRASERRFSNIGEILSAFRTAEVRPELYEPAISALDSYAITEFNVTLNEAQRLSIVQTDTTE